MVQSSVAVKYIKPSASFGKSMESPPVMMKDIGPVLDSTPAPAYTSFTFGLVSRLSWNSSVISSPLRSDHSMMRPSPDIETKVSSLPSL